MNTKSWEIIYSYVAIPDHDIEHLQKWLIEAMKQFQFYPLLEHTADIITIDNHIGSLPKDIVRLAWVAHVECDQLELCSDCNKIDDDLYDCSCCDDNVTPQHPVDLMGKQVCRIKKQGIVYLYDYYALLHGINNIRNYSLMKEKSHPFQKRINPCNECPELYNVCSETYEISINDRIITSFEDGCICIDYYRLPRDQRNNLLVINHETYLQAIAAYIMMKYHERAWNLAEEGHARKMQYYMGRWQALKRRAIGELAIDLHDIQAMLGEMYKETNKSRTPLVWNNRPYYRKRR